ncbi:hypothetical protein LINPERPRIM_LOCUS37657 [Linum perenne]
MPICRRSLRTRMKMLCATAIYERLYEFLAQRKIICELQLRQAQAKKHELDSTLERVKKFPYDEATRTCNVHRSEASILRELEVIKA